MPVLSAPTFAFAIGDTFVMPVTYLNPPNADGTAGTPIDLTGATVSGVLFTRGPAPGIELTVDNGGVTVDPALGLMTFVVDEGVTENFAADTVPPFADSFDFPTRLQVRVRDTLGHVETIALFPVHVFDPRSANPAAFPLSQAGTVIAGALTPAQAAAMIAAAVAPLEAALAALAALQPAAAPVTP